MTQVQTVTSPTTSIPKRASAAVRSYRYLRLSLVGVVVLLLQSVWLERHFGNPSDHELGSISAYFYTPARGVFVSALVTMGISLVAMAGRRGWEDSALNLAGMMAPVVAFVPTPRGPGGTPCDPYLPCTVPAEAVPAVVNNVWGLILLGALGIGLATYLVFWRSDRSLPLLLSYWLAVAAWAGFVFTFLFLRSLFLHSAHYVAAVALCILVTFVAGINARMASGALARAYLVVAVMMGVALGSGVLCGLATRFTTLPTPPEWVLKVEVGLLISFAVFWTLQTIDYWSDAVPAEASSTPA